MAQQADCMTQSNVKVFIKHAKDLALVVHENPEMQCCVVSLIGVEFAEFDPRHDLEDMNLLITEDYALRVLELPVLTLSANRV